MFARAVRPAARSLRLATAPRVAPAARAVRFNASQAGPNQGGSQYTSTTDGQQLLMVLLAGGALFASVSYVEKHRRTNTAPNPESSGAAEEEIDEVDEEEDAAEGQPEQGPNASEVNSAKEFVHDVDMHLDALIDNAERALKGDYTPNTSAGMPPLGADAQSQGAYNEETGEINWDCPCLGGMATGPCGDEFKAAFSCFVHSSEEPKGMDCIEQFRGMQECFRAHPDVYGEEIADMDNESPRDA